MRRVLDFLAFVVYRVKGSYAQACSCRAGRAASRYVTGVRVERLQDISEVDARAEGCRCNEDTLAETGFATYRDAYKALWETINGDTSWDLNPWVWAIEFRRLA